MADFQAEESDNVRSRVVPFPVEATSAMFTAREAATSLGVAERTVRRAIARGELSAVKVRGAFRIRQADLATYAQTVVRVRVQGEREQAHPAWVTWQPPPEPSTPLVGRAADLCALEAALANPAVRLITLIGPGGIGKTRLAIAAAQAAEVGVVFVNLAPLTREAQVAPAIAQGLGLAGAATSWQRLREVFQDLRALLVIDNVEHVLGAAPMLARLLEAAPGLKILATSRAALRLTGEHLLLVPPLLLPASAGDRPTLAEIAEAEAVALFVARAQASDPAFHLSATHASAVAAICRRLEGIPLALELAASWIRVLPPEVLLERLATRLPLLVDGPRDAPARQQTMRRAIAWSFDLLTEAEQGLFLRLAVFAGGFTLAAVEAIAADLAEPGAPLALLTSLLDTSMVIRDPSELDQPRFGMLEMLREYGLERLHASGEADHACRLHAIYMARLVKDAEGRVPRPDRWWIVFDRERENLRAALDWCVAAGEAETGLRLAVEVFGYWMLRGLITEGIGWLEQLRHVPGELPPDLHARAVLGLGYMQWFAGDALRAATLAQESREFGEATGDLMTQAVAMFLLGFVGEARGDLPAARLAYQAAHDCYQAVGLPVGQASVNAHLGRVVARAGDPARGRALLQEALGTLEWASGAWGSATAHADLALIAWRGGERAHAIPLLLQSLRRHRALDDRLVVLPSLTVAARVLAEVGEPRAITRLLGAVQVLGERAGSCLWAISEQAYAEAEAITLVALGEELFAAECAAGRTLTLETALELAVDSLMRADPALGARADPALSPAPRPHLSRRALDVLRLVAERHTDREIAERLFISRRTVEWYVSDILSRLHVGTRHEAVVAARAQGLI